MTETLILSLVYTVVVFVVVSLNLTYNLTNKVFGKVVGQPNQASYGLGLSLNNRGFLLHILVFALLVGIPMFYATKQAVAA